MIHDPEPAARREGRTHFTYTTWLRGRSDSQLDTLLALRPDLLSPVPADVAALAARATARTAIQRCLDRLDLFTLRTLVALVALSGPRDSPASVTADDLTSALAAPRGAVDRSLGRLRDSALIWDDAPRLRPVRALYDIFPEPAGLGPPMRELLSALSPDRRRPNAPCDSSLSAETLNERIASAGPEARAVLDRLAWGPPHGTVEHAYREVDSGTAESPIDRLLALGLIVPTAEETVTLPREVALHLRSGRLFTDVQAEPPELTGTRCTQEAVDRAAAGQAFAAIRQIEELLESWAEDPPGVLRTGGLGIRDLRETAHRLDSDTATAAVLVETAAGAGLLSATGEVDGEWLPTVRFDEWRAEKPARRWVKLVQAWLHSTRVPGLVGEKDGQGRTRGAALGGGLDHAAAPETRMELLRALAQAPEGTAPGSDAQMAYLAWSRPRQQGTANTAVVAASGHEAGVLGLTGTGALATHARLLIRGSPAEAATALEPLLPEPLDHVLLQGDLTAIAPGPLIPELSRELAAAADVESTGGATVYRFSAGSIRRALNSGRGADELVELLDRHSRTPVPQSLRYLIFDESRRHGRLRIGSAMSYLRCDDPGILDELVNDRRASDLGLFRLASTVVASALARPSLLERLEALGYHPVPEARDGTVQLRRSAVRRAEAAPVSSSQPAPPEPELRAAAVRAIRSGDEAATAGRQPVAAPAGEPPRSPAAATMLALNSALREGRRVWIGYVDNTGLSRSHIVEPARLDGGYLTAYDATRAAVHRFAVHHITGVAELDGEAMP